MANSFRQLAFESILDASFRERQRILDRYCAENRQRYIGMAELIRPDLSDWRSVWTRAAFAILSANTSFKAAVAALGYATKRIGHADPEALSAYGMTPAKAEWLNALPRELGTRQRLLRGNNESWHDYRTRLQATVKGFALAKASFCAALLYPTNADVACIDTHMQKVYLGHGSFKRLSVVSYLAVESKVRKVAQRHDVCTFLAQWMIWDATRGKVENHDIFPGSHKTESEGPSWLA